MNPFAHLFMSMVWNVIAVEEMLSVVNQLV